MIVVVFSNGANYILLNRIQELHRDGIPNFVGGICICIVVVGICIVGSLICIVVVVVVVSIVVVVVVIISIVVVIIVIVIHNHPHRLLRASSSHDGAGRRVGAATAGVDQRYLLELRRHHLNQIAHARRGAVGEFAIVQGDFLQGRRWACGAVTVQRSTVVVAAAAARHENHQLAQTRVDKGALETKRSKFQSAPVGALIIGKQETQGQHLSSLQHFLALIPLLLFHPPLLLVLGRLLWCLSCIVVVIASRSRCLSLLWWCGISLWIAILIVIIFVFVDLIIVVNIGFQEHSNSVSLSIRHRRQAAQICRHNVKFGTQIPQMSPRMIEIGRTAVVARRHRNSNGKDKSARVVGRSRSGNIIVGVAIVIIVVVDLTLQTIGSLPSTSPGLFGSTDIWIGVSWSPCGGGGHRRGTIISIVVLVVVAPRNAHGPPIVEPPSLSHFVLPWLLRIIVIFLCSSGCPCPSMKYFLGHLDRFTSSAAGIVQGTSTEFFLR
mmetsp:Transcript_6718/g.17298  ORF Transcript_6718/g.17298 Transcript_6718/m.17298 type:complete len:493 (+) Transcript_6718:1602-3080(+)